VFAEWLRGSRLRSADGLLVLSVGGGSVEQNISPNLVAAVQYAKEQGASILGIVGRDGGYTAKVADIALIVPEASADRTTPHAEEFQGVLWHLLLSHPTLKRQKAKMGVDAMSRPKAVFLDRDGVLNRHVLRDGKAVAPRRLEDFEIYPEAHKACSLLTKKGFLLVVATNQPDVGRGLMPRDVVHEMHARITRTLPIRRVEVSFDPADTPAARRRKPEPGMLLDAASHSVLTLVAVILLGIAGVMWSAVGVRDVRPYLWSVARPSRYESHRIFESQTCLRPPSAFFRN
jgi:histidinol-phosphate phosphatase family protein